MLPVGKLPQDLLAKIISNAPSKGSRVLLGPGIGLDCAVLEFGASCLVLKTDPITFTSNQIGWYAVQIAVNDIVTTGALPKWMLLTALLPENGTTPELVEEISNQLFDVCRTLDIAFIGGHTEITHNLDRPILVTTMIGEVARDKLITPKGAQPGDVVILTKGIPIEGTAILAREFPERLSNLLPAELVKAKNYLFSPGISVYKDALTAISSGKVTAMHDPTEGGIANALWELAEACQHTIMIDPSKIPMSSISREICAAFGLDPFGVIASGCLIIVVAPESKDSIVHALHNKRIDAVDIGIIQTGSAEVLTRTETGIRKLSKFPRDEITRVFE